MNIKLTSDRKAHKLYARNSVEFACKQYLLLFPDGSCEFKAIYDDREVPDEERCGIKPLFIFFGESKRVISYINIKVFIMDNKNLFQTIIEGFDEVANGTEIFIDLTEKAQDAYNRLRAIAAIL